MPWVSEGGRGATGVRPKSPPKKARFGHGEQVSLSKQKTKKFMVLTVNTVINRTKT